MHRLCTISKFLPSLIRLFGLGALDGAGSERALLIRRIHFFVESLDMSAIAILKLTGGDGALSATVVYEFWHAMFVGFSSATARYFASEFRGLMARCAVRVSQGIDTLVRDGFLLASG